MALLLHQERSTLAFIISDCGDFAVKCKSELGIVDGYLTNILFAVKWPETDPNASLINAASPLFTLIQQGSTVQSGAFNYAIFAAKPNVLLNWTAGTEYTVLTFSHDKGGVGTGDFVIGADTWTTANNANYFAELSGEDNTGTIYASALNVSLGNPVCNITGTDGPVCPSSSNGFSAPAGMSTYAWTYIRQWNHIRCNQCTNCNCKCRYKL